MEKRERSSYERQDRKREEDKEKREKDRRGRREKIKIASKQFPFSQAGA
jgi:hypothetical protein